MRRAALLAVMLAAGLTLPALALGDTSRAAANAQTYQDATGEDPSAPDISTVAVSNDDTGAITFRVTIANRPTFTSDMLVLLFLDTAEGGDPETVGADYAIQLDDRGGVLFKWNGTDFLSDTPQRTLTSSYEAGVATFGVAASELGGAKALDFAVVALSGIVTTPSGDVDVTQLHRDIAPTFAGAATTWRYEVKTTLVLSPAGFSTSPSVARAGGPFSAALAATRNDTRGLVRAGTVTCQARVGGRSLRATGSRVRAGVATCVWALPASARGKTITGTVTLVVDGARLARSFSVRIR